MLQEHARSHGGTVFSGGLLLKVPPFIRVKYLVDGWDSSMFLISQTTLLCLCTWRACIYCRVQHNNTSGHVSIEFVLHNEQVGFGKRVGQKRFFCAFPMYCHFLNFSSCLI